VSYTKVMLIFRITAQQPVDVNPTYLYMWGHLTPLVYSVSNENEYKTHQRISVLVQPSANAPRPFKMRDSPFSDVSMRALIQMQDILCTYCALCIVT
jgi:hypothetical protein